MPHPWTHHAAYQLLLVLLGLPLELQHRLLELQTLTFCNPESGILTIAEATATRMMWLQSRHVDLFDASILVLRVYIHEEAHA